MIQYKASYHNIVNKLCGRLPQYAPASCKLTFDLLTLKVVSESHVTWATSVPIVVFLGLSVLDVGPIYTTARQSDVRQHHRLMPRLLGAGHNNTLWRRTAMYSSTQPMLARRPWVQSNIIHKT